MISHYLDPLLKERLLSRSMKSSSSKKGDFLTSYNLLQSPVTHSPLYYFFLVLGTQFVSYSTLITRGSDPSLHWHYHLYTSAFLVVAIRGDAPLSPAVWKYFIDILMNPSSSIPIKHVTLLALSYRLFPYLQVGAKDTLDGDIRKIVLSNEFMNRWNELHFIIYI